MRKDFADYDADTLPDISVRPDGSDIRSSDEGINFTADKQLINFPADSTFQFSNNSIIIFWIKPNTEVGANSIPIFEKAN